MKKFYDFKWRWYTWVALVMLLACFPLGRIMPEHWGWENGVLETIQMLLLVLGACASFCVAKTFPPGDRMRKFWFWSIGCWGFVFARELSFGRSFCPFLKTPDGGREMISFWSQWRLFSFSAPWESEPLYIPRDEMLLGDYIYVIVFLAVIVTVLALLRYFDWKNIKRVVTIPVFLVLFFLIAERAVMVAEHRIYPVPESQREVLEESAEVIRNWCLLFIVFANCRLITTEQIEQKSDEKQA